MPATNWPLVHKVQELSDGKRNSAEIAALLGLNPRHVRKIWTRHNMPRPNQGAQFGKKNHAYKYGRRINHAGYAMVTAPKDHPSAHVYTGKKTGWVFEHRLLMEEKLGRFLTQEEVVDHIDGLTLHNRLDNLRLFANNAEHLRATTQGQVPHWSEEGYENMVLKGLPFVDLVPVDIHRRRTAAGATRLHQICLAALRLGTDSPYLLGSSHHTEKAGIDMSSRSKIERALVDLCQQWGWPPPQL